MATITALNTLNVPLPIAGGFVIPAHQTRAGVDTAQPRNAQLLASGALVDTGAGGGTAPPPPADPRYVTVDLATATNGEAIVRDTTKPSGWDTVPGSGVPDGSVGTAKLADGAVTVAKLAFDPATQAELDAVSATIAGLRTYRGPWTASTAYKAGQLVTNPSGQLVAAKADFTSSSSYAKTAWTDADVDAFRGAWQANADYLAGEVVTQAGLLYQALADFTSASTFVPGNWTSLGSSGSGVDQTARDAAAAAQSTATAKYSKPSGGIPEADLTSSVQAKLNASGGGGGTTNIDGGAPDSVMTTNFDGGTP